MIPMSLTAGHAVFQRHRVIVPLVRVQFPFPSPGSGGTGVLHAGVLRCYCSAHRVDSALSKSNSAAPVPPVPPCCTVPRYTPATVFR